MWRALLTLGLAVIWDRFLGEPPEKIHPVVWMGRAVEFIGEPTGDEETDSRRGLIATGSPATRLRGDRRGGRSDPESHGPHPGDPGAARSC